MGYIYNHHLMEFSMLSMGIQRVYNGKLWYSDTMGYHGYDI